MRLIDDKGEQFLDTQNDAGDLRVNEYTGAPPSVSPTMPQTTCADCAGGPHYGTLLLGGVLQQKFCPFSPIAAFVEILKLFGERVSAINGLQKFRDGPFPHPCLSRAARL
jgi:hypothetical protein